VGLFYVRCLMLAVRTGDRWTLDAATRPRELSRLVDLAGGRKVVVEDGTASGWTAAALALAERERTVITVDPEVRPLRERYLTLLDPATRARLRLVRGRTQEGPEAVGGGLPPVEMLFLDGDHGREGVIAAFSAWRPVLADGAVVAFHDYGDPVWPEVTEAVTELGLSGRAHGTLFVARV
jgi:predicted O-methyltransferase YrrM